MSGELASFEVDGYQLVYQDLGEGTPVLLVHGSLCDYRYWQWQLRSLGERHRLIVPSGPRLPVNTVHRAASRPRSCVPTSTAR